MVANSHDFLGANVLVFIVILLLCLFLYHLAEVRQKSFPHSILAMLIGKVHWEGSEVDVE